MKHSTSETASVPEQEGPSRWQQLRQWLGFVGSTSQREVDVALGTTEFEAIDPLGGFFHPEWEKHKQQEAADAKRFILRRAFAHFAKWMLSDEPNLTTGDTRLDVDPEEMRNPRPLSPQQKADKKAAIAAFDGVGPADTHFYDDLLSVDPQPEHH